MTDTCLVCHEPLDADEEAAVNEYGEPVAHIFCAAGDWDRD